MLSAEAAVQTRRTVESSQRRLNDDGPGAAEGIPEEIPSPVAGQIDQSRRHGLVEGCLVAHGAVATLVEAHAGGVQKDLADVLHDGKAELVGVARLRQPGQAVFGPQTVYGGLFHDGLAVGDAVALGIQAVALDGEGTVLGDEALQRDGLDTLIEGLETVDGKARQEDHHPLAHAQTHVGPGHSLKIAVKEDAAVLHTDIFHLHTAQLVAHQSLQPEQAGDCHCQSFHGYLRNAFYYFGDEISRRNHSHILRLSRKGRAKWRLEKL